MTTNNPREVMHALEEDFIVTGFWNGEWNRIHSLTQVSNGTFIAGWSSVDGRRYDPVDQTDTFAITEQEPAIYEQ